jgi:hypothetical protein
VLKKRGIRYNAPWLMGETVAETVADTVLDTEVVVE